MSLLSRSKSKSNLNSSNSSNFSNFSNTSEKIGKGIQDNGAKWGSYVKRNSDGSFPFDERMKKERSSDWEKMIEERISPMYETSRNPPYKIPKKWAIGRTN